VADAPSFRVVFEELLLRLASPLQKEVRELIIELGNGPGENQKVLFLDLSDGHLVIDVMRQATWHRTYLVNEPDEQRFRLVSDAISARWGADDLLQLHNLSTDAFLSQLPERSIMFVATGQSLWDMSNEQLQICLKKLNRCLHPNGCIVLLAPVQPREPKIASRMSDRIKQSLPMGSASDTLSERLGEAHMRTEEDYEIMLLEARFSYECLGKSQVFQCWLLTHTRQVRGTNSLFSIY